MGGFCTNSRYELEGLLSDCQVRTDACLFVQQLQTSSITTLDLTYKRSYFPPLRGAECPPEPVFPMLGDAENSGAFFRALAQLSQQLKVFFYRGRGSDEMFAEVNRQGTWEKLEYMMVEFDVLDTAGFYWVDFHEESDSDGEDDFSEEEETDSDESGSSHSDDEYNRYEGLDGYDAWGEYTPRRPRWDNLFENVARAVSRMPKVALLVVGVNPGMPKTVISAQYWSLLAFFNDAASRAKPFASQNPSSGLF